MPLMQQLLHPRPLPRPGPGSLGCSQPLQVLVAVSLGSHTSEPVKVGQEALHRAGGNPPTCPATWPCTPGSPMPDPTSQVTPPLGAPREASNPNQTLQDSCLPLEVPGTPSPCIYGHLICVSSRPPIYLQVLISFGLIEVQAHKVSLFDPQIGYESQSNRQIFTRLLPRAGDRRKINEECW